MVNAKKKRFKTSVKSCLRRGLTHKLYNLHRVILPYGARFIAFTVLNMLRNDSRNIYLHLSISECDEHQIRLNHKHNVFGAETQRVSLQLIVDI